MRLLRVPLAFAGLLLIACSQAASKPNIVFILCDDLGYGDVSCFNPEGKIRTPNIDRLAREGMRFTDAHSSSAVCTPTRYALLTGRYNWRSRLQRGVLGGLSPRLIEERRLTVPAFLKQHGYHTACIGKWHLGMDWARREGKDVSPLSIETAAQVWNVDYGKRIENGPNSVGFDYYFGISASLDMVPYTFIENDRVVSLPTEERDFEMFLGRAKGRTRKGPAAPGFEAEDVLPELTKAAVRYIGERAEASRGGEPFFLYVPFASPHTPILPTAEWQGKSGLNHYGDFVMQQDGAVGEIMKALDEHRLSANTLFIFTSDNGCSPQADFRELREKGHEPSGQFRGAKADIYEGGHRVPFIARWPGKVKPGSRTAALAGLQDLFATCAELLDENLPPNAGEDSISFLGLFLGDGDKHQREALVHHSINGSFAIREGPWKLILCPGSGGWSAPRPGREERGLPTVQLYNLDNDPAERENVQEEHPGIVSRLTELLERYVREGRSTPGAAQPNTLEPEIGAKVVQSR